MIHAKERAPFLRIPPFPGHRIARFGFAPTAGGRDDERPYELLELIRRLRVGGCYWGAQPDLPFDHLLVRGSASLRELHALAAGAPIVAWPAAGTGALPRGSAAIVLQGECDPWHVLSRARALVVDNGLEELCVIAAILEIPVYRRSQIDGELERQELNAAELLVDALPKAGLLNPFTGQPMTIREAIELCGFWRRLVDSNRDIGGGVGFAFWKQRNVAALLWGGSEPFRFLKNVPPKGSTAIAVWRSKAPPAILAGLDRNQVPLVEVEDGFLRSQGLGADCVPPLSLTVDRLGAYFDPTCPSELEQLLQYGEFDERLLARARRLRQLTVEAGLGKYERGAVALQRPAGRRRHILVPGQVEDDRSVQTGGSGLDSNLELLARVRENAPDAYILYKPHPDVVAGHRKGFVAEPTCRQYADEVVRGIPISSLIAMADEIHVNTSLTGFEALMRDKPVTTYGVPFYAGWGLTSDLGPVPSRRTARRSTDELVAATLLLYPRYLDPVTGLPCPAEVVVERLSTGVREANATVVLRRLQGRLVGGLRSLIQ